MADLGKVDRAFFEEHVYPHLGTDRDDVLVGPRHGVDFGAIEIDDRVLALATDPIFVMPELGFERAAWFAVHILLSDVAVSGLAPTHLSVDFNLPPEITDEQFRTIWETFDRELRNFGVSVVTGHTARYSNCRFPMIGGGTAMAVGDPENLVRPDGARPGDAIVVTKGPAVEAAGVTSVLFGDRLDLPAETVAAATERFYDATPVRDALVAAETDHVTAMHDATERGLFGAFVEVAESAGVRLDIERPRIPIMAGVAETCEALGMDPWSASSSGTLVIAVAPDGADDVVAALEDAGTPAAVVGAVGEGEGVHVDGEQIEYPQQDPFWPTVEALMAEETEAED